LVILPGITSSRTRNPLEEWNSAGNYQLLDEEFTGRMELCRELPAPEQGIHQKSGIPLGITFSWSWIQTRKIKNLPIGNNSRNINSKGSLPRKNNFLKFKYEKLILMKNKTDSALLQASYIPYLIKP
jgi:hypothetical protein